MSNAPAKHRMTLARRLRETPGHLERLEMLLDKFPGTDHDRVLARAFYMLDGASKILRENPYNDYWPSIRLPCRLTRRTRPRRLAWILCVEALASFGAAVIQKLRDNPAEVWALARSATIYKRHRPSLTDCVRLRLELIFRPNWTMSIQELKDALLNGTWPKDLARFEARPTLSLQAVMDALLQDKPPPHQRWAEYMLYGECFTLADLWQRAPISLASPNSSSRENFRRIVLRLCRQMGYPIKTRSKKAS